MLVYHGASAGMPKPQEKREPDIALGSDDGRREDVGDDGALRISSGTWQVSGMDLARRSSVSQASSCGCASGYQAPALALGMAVAVAIPLSVPPPVSLALAVAWLWSCLGFWL